MIGGIVKKYDIIFVSVIIFIIGGLFSCNKENINDITEENIYMTFSGIIDYDNSRTILQEDNSVYWEKGDSINIFTESGYSSKFIASGSGSETYFEGYSYVSNGYYSLYPYNKDAKLVSPRPYVGGSDSISTFLPQSQCAIKDSFDPQANISVTEAQDDKLQFHNICSLIKFKLAGINAVRVSFRGNLNEKLAGKITTCINSLESNISDYPFTMVSLTNNEGLLSEQWYYITVMPQELKNGFSIDIIDENGNGYVLVGRNPVTLKNGRILNLGILSTSSISPSFFYDKINNCYTVNDANGFIAWGAVARNTLEGNCILMSDIDLKNHKWKMIGDFYHSFKGKLDGNNHTISNFNGESLFAYVENSTISNINFDNSNVQTEGTFVIRLLNSTLSNCNAINATMSLDEEQLTRIKTTGGIVGMSSDSQIIGCTYDGNIKINTSRESGAVEVGGIVGSLNDKSYVIGCVSSSIINNPFIYNWSYGTGGIAGFSAGNIIACASSGYIDTGYYVGGLVGQVLNGTVISSYSTCEIPIKTVAYYGTIFGIITDSTVKNCYSTYYDYGLDIAGFSEDNSLSNCSRLSLESLISNKDEMNRILEGYTTDIYKGNWCFDINEQDNQRQLPLIPKKNN